MVYDEIIERYLAGGKISPGLPIEYDDLRSIGIELTQQLSGELWTDYNLHDPGLTILEHLCYALTDLAYRTNFDIEDILTAKSGYIDRSKNFFFTRREIMSINPVSINDFRKLIIDSVPEIFNVWFEPVLSQNRMQYCKGLYKVVIQVNDQQLKVLEQNRENDKEITNILGKVKNCVNTCRNVGEDVEDFVILKPVEVKINAVVGIGPNEFAEEVLAEIYAALFKTLNPKINFYSEGQLNEKGYSPEEINNGPMLNNGFISDEELVPRPKFVDPSDLVKAMADIKAVLHIQDLFIEVKGKKYVRELCPIDDEDFLFFKYDSENISIHLVNDNFHVPVNHSLFLSRLHVKFHHTASSGMPAEKKHDEKGLNNNEQFKIKGIYRSLHKYASIQNLFPEIYKLKINLEDRQNYNNPNLITDIAKVKQLKAFLMLFEQVIANYLAQIANVDNIFSADMGHDELNKNEDAPKTGTNKNYQTYFTQPIFDVPGADKIISAFNDGSKGLGWNEFKNNSANPYSTFLDNKTEPDSVFINRKNRIFDHILSRFNFTFHQYPLQLYSELYGINKFNGRLTPELSWKQGILKNLISLLRNKNQAFNFAQQNTMRRMGGFLEKMHRLLYIGVEELQGASKADEFFIKPLSEVFSKVTMTQTTTRTNEPGETKIPEIFIIHYNNEDLHIVKDIPRLTLGDGENQPLVFKKAGIGFFRNGLDIKNYKIVTDNDNEKTILLIFKNELSGPLNELTWQIVGRFKSVSAAMKSRKDFIGDLRKWNIDSEGFHVIEHILLRPDLQFSQFGFKILDEQKHVLCTQPEWTSFEKRDKNIAKLINYSRNSTDFSDSHLEIILENLCKIAVDHSNAPQNIVKPSFLRYEYRNKPAEKKKIYEQLIGTLANISDNRASAYANTKTFVKRINDQEIPEDFFNSRITVVLPSWPARFQDIPFQRFVRKLFLENCPAHIRVHFKWLDIKDMKAFESCYFKWLADINKDKASLNILELADKMITLLYDPSDYQ